jgi:hypothetical protein
MALKEIEWNCVDWIYLAQYCDNWRAVVNTVMNFGFRKIGVISLPAQELLASQEGLCSVVLD